MQQKCDKMSNVSRLEKISLLTLVQGAKYYPITRQENLEILGEIGGGAKITDQILEYQILKERHISFTSMKKGEENTNCRRY